MEKFIIRYVLCGVVFWLGLSVAMFGKNLTMPSCSLSSYEGDLLHHPYPLDNKCIMLKHFENLKQILYADFAKYPEKGVFLSHKIKTVEAKIDSINAAPLSFACVLELSLVANAGENNSDKSDIHSDEISTTLKGNLRIAMWISAFIAFGCFIGCLKPDKNANPQSRYHFAIGFCVFLVLALILGSLAF